jgi:TonB family protein
LGFNAFGQQNADLKKDKTEHVLTPACTGPSDVNCTQKSLEEAVLPVLQKHLKELPVDTLNLNLEFTVTSKGRLDQVQVRLNLRKSALSDKLAKRLEKALKTLEPFSVLDYNSGNYPSWHRFYYQFEVLKPENQLKSTGMKSPYSGGVILKIPLFPPCSRKNTIEDQKCFQQQMQAHIESHFKYPEAVRRQGIQGTVLIQFNIDEKGAIRDVKTKGPHPLLTSEALRIVSLLPQFQPAMEGEKPVRIPYSIPIAFKLNSYE